MTRVSRLSFRFFCEIVSIVVKHVIPDFLMINFDPMSLKLIPMWKQYARQEKQQNSYDCQC